MDFRSGSFGCLSKDFLHQFMTKITLIFKQLLGAARLLLNNVDLERR